MNVATPYRTVPEVAAELRLSTRTIYRAIESGHLAAIRLTPNGRLRIPADAVDRLSADVRAIRSENGG